MKQTTFGLKLGTILLAIISLSFAMFFSPVSITTKALQDFDAAATYKAKCAMCHGAKAEKKFDTAKTDEQLVEAILKGKDGTPKMPAYEGKVTTEQAQALVTLMKSLRQ